MYVCTHVFAFMYDLHLITLLSILRLALSIDMLTAFVRLACICVVVCHLRVCTHVLACLLVCTRVYAFLPRYIYTHVLALLSHSTLMCMHSCTDLYEQMYALLCTKSCTQVLTSTCSCIACTHMCTCIVVKLFEYLHVCTHADMYAHLFTHIWFVLDNMPLDY